MTALRLPQVKAKTGLGKSRIYGLIQEGRFPRPIKLGDKAVGWLENELDDWLRGRGEMREKVT